MGYRVQQTTKQLQHAARQHKHLEQTAKMYNIQNNNNSFNQQEPSTPINKIQQSTQI